MLKPPPLSLVSGERSNGGRGRRFAQPPDFVSCSISGDLVISAQLQSPPPWTMSVEQG
ncbi:hypothetical protein JCGZ_15298 [Jatropha curcas]|uniref:Uncharacterized protein n=1 Tax=Jatropha curcas TaxID=180498 RepID=A0A067LN30_JATCU|nr:hypothetical protein JCGZ_15298 [Jatropha curcas]